MLHVPITSTAKRCLHYFTLNLQWMVYLQPMKSSTTSKGLVETRWQEQWKGMQEKMWTPTTSEDEDGSDANYNKTLDEAQCKECSFI